MISFYEGEAALFLEEKTKQVQVRLPPALHSKLKGTLAFENKTLVDFFNEAAEAYLADGEKYKETITQILGGKQNG